MITEQEQLQQIRRYYAAGNSRIATGMLDDLLSAFARRGDVKKIINTLKKLLNVQPYDPALRGRLIAVYDRLGHTRAAIEQLDILGEVQVETGDYKGAVRTIRAIQRMLR